ncbi:MAG: hypothetical protein U1D55_13425 [Phycisphaerae bacterium]
MGLSLALLTLLPGCWTPPAAQDERRKIAELERRVEQKDAELATQKVAIEKLEEQLRTVRAVNSQDLRKLTFADRIAIVSPTGAEDYDGKPGTDGITVYIQPIDAEGDVVKTVGDVRVELYDLAAPPESNRIGQCDFSSDELKKLWFGKLMTNHFKLRCPWRDERPAHPEITVRVIFTDFLTQRVLTAQTLCTVRGTEK